MCKQQVTLSIGIQTFSLPCRDRGWGGVDAGALCLSSSGRDPFASQNRYDLYGEEDRHKAPAHPRIHPLSLQMFGNHKRLSGSGACPFVGTRAVWRRSGDPCGRPRSHHRSYISPLLYDEWRRDVQMAKGTPTRVPTPPPHRPRPYGIGRRSSSGRLAA